jgi:hypothetical protein
MGFNSNTIHMQPDTGLMTKNMQWLINSFHDKNRNFFPIIKTLSQFFYNTF